MRSLALLAVLVLVPAARADDTGEARIKEYLKGLEGGEFARVTALTGDGIKETFPDHDLFAVLFPLYPVGRVAPEPLKNASVIAVPRKKDAKPVPLTDTKALQKFFAEHARPVKKAEEGEETVKAFLRAAAELRQDGFYRFTVKADKPAIEGGNGTASGQAPVDPQGGNKGEVKATLTFKDGKLATAETKANLTPGVRPICQATKLLDPDPIVRGMAEQAIRVMGSAAEPYLAEQYAKASPQLRAAIDRMRARIAAEGR